MIKYKIVNNKKKKITLEVKIMLKNVCYILNNKYNIRKNLKLLKRLKIKF